MCLLLFFPPAWSRLAAALQKFCDSWMTVPMSNRLVARRDRLDKPLHRVLWHP
jgi:hypothetical protein